MPLYDFTVLLLSLHCGTWDMYPVAVPLNAHASIVQIYMYYKFHKTVEDIVHVHTLFNLLNGYYK